MLKEYGMNMNIPFVRVQCASAGFLKNQQSTRRVQTSHWSGRNIEEELLMVNGANPFVLVSRTIKLRLTYTCYVSAGWGGLR